jgi:hypothetical protein
LVSLWSSSQQPNHVRGPRRHDWFQRWCKVRALGDTRMMRRIFSAVNLSLYRSLEKNAENA